MIDPHEPRRLSEFDPLVKRAIERARTEVPSARSVDAVMQAVKMQAVKQASAAGAGSASTAGLLGTSKLMAGQLVVVAALSVGAWWTVVASRSVDEATRVPARQVSASPETAAAQAGDRALPTPPAPQPAETTLPAGGHAIAAARGPAVASRPARAHALPRSSPAAGVARRSSAADSRALRAPGVTSFPRETQRAVALDAAAQRPQSEPAAVVPRAARTGEASELDLVAEAQRALRLAPQHALDLTDQHRSDYPDGTYAQEREQIAIDALFKIGRTSVARERARRFLVTFPRSPYAPRIAERIARAP